MWNRFYQSCPKCYDRSLILEIGNPKKREPCRKCKQEYTVGSNIRAPLSVRWVMNIMWDHGVSKQHLVECAGVTGASVRKWLRDHPTLSSRTTPKRRWKVYISRNNGSMWYRIEMKTLIGKKIVVMLEQ